MAARHGTRRSYTEGCRCDDCKGAQRLYQQRYRERRADRAVARLPQPVPEGGSPPGPVESGVEAEIRGVGAEARPGLAQAALALARILDNPKAVSQQPAAAKVLGALLEKLRSASARGRRGSLAVVRAMSASDDTPTALPGPSGAPRHPPAGGIGHSHTP
jgi:hypothetical protein